MTFQLDSGIYSDAARVGLAQQLGQQNIAASRQDMGLNNEKIKQAKVERAAQYLGMATPENWQGIRQQAISEGLGSEDTIPQQYDANWISQTRSAFASSGGQLPTSAIQNHNFAAMLGEKYGKDSPQVNNFNEFARGSQVRDAGGNIIAYQPLSGATTVVAPKTLAPGETPETRAAQEEAKLRTTAKTNAEINLPSTLQKAQQSINVIDQMIGGGMNPETKRPYKEHSGLEAAVGFKGTSPSYAFGLKDNAVGGTEAADFEALFGQVQGAAFLEAFETLKGGGQITEVEGAKATSAINRMRLSQSEAEFKAAAKEFRDVLAAGMERSKNKAGVTPKSQPQQPSAPAASGNLNFDDLP